jgi:hypothetical protein
VDETEVRDGDETRREVEPTRRDVVRLKVDPERIVEKASRQGGQTRTDYSAWLWEGGTRWGIVEGKNW